MIHPCKGLFSALLIASPSLGSVSNPHSDEPAAASTHRQQVQSSQNLRICLIQVWQQLHTHADAANPHTHRRISVRVHLFMCQHVWLQCVCVYTCMIELAAETKQAKKRKAENVCECGRICKGITAGIISTTVEGHKHTHTNTAHTHTSNRDPVSTAHSLTGAHMQNTPTHKVYMHTGRETNSLPVMHCSTPGSCPYGLIAWTTNNTHPITSSKFSFNNVTSQT